MNKASKKLFTILAFLLMIFIVPLVSFAVNENVSIVESLDKNGKQEYIIYINNYTNKNFKYALSNDANPEEMDLVYINSITDLGKNSVAFIDAETYEKLKSKTIYIWAKDENESLILKGVKLDLENSLTKENLDLVEKTTKKISVEIADSKEKSTEIKNEDVEGVKETTSVGTLKITDEDAKKSTYYYERVETTDSEDYNELSELAEKINNEYEAMDMYKKIQIAKEFNTLYSKLISNIEWKEVKDLKVEQPESSEQSNGIGDKYIVFLKKVSKNGEMTTDVQFLQEYYDYEPNVEKESKHTIETFNQIEIKNDEEQETESSNEIQLEYKGYKVIGIVKIPQINIEYPIIEIGDIDPESAKKPMKLSIIKYWGEKVNDYGNLSIAGHNNKDGTMFGKTKKLKIGDIVELTDLTGKTITYSIYNIFVTDPNDVNILLPQDEKIREVTLITCTNGNKQRLILKAKEI